MENREIDIRRYWANVIRGVDEFDQIATGENPEFKDLTECLTFCLQNGFVRDATEYGVERWEKILGISPVDGSTLEDRKINILYYLNVQLPYTFTMVKEFLATTLGEENVLQCELFNNTYTLKLRVITSSLNAYVNILKYLENVVPMNMIVDIERVEER